MIKLMVQRNEKASKYHAKAVTGKSKSINCSIFARSILDMKENISSPIDGNEVGKAKISFEKERKGHAC